MLTAHSTAHYVNFSRGENGGSTEFLPRERVKFLQRANVKIAGQRRRGLPPTMSLFRLPASHASRRFIPAETDPIIRYAPEHEPCRVSERPLLSPRISAAPRHRHRPPICRLTMKPSSSPPPPVCCSRSPFSIPRADVICRMVYPGIRGKSRLRVRRTESLFTNHVRWVSLFQSLNQRT